MDFCFHSVDINPSKVKCSTRVGLQVGPEVRERGPVVLAGGGGGVHGAREADLRECEAARHTEACWISALEM